MKFPKPNKRGINRLIAKIKAAPLGSHVMGTWEALAYVNAKGDPVAPFSAFIAGSEYKCQTAACIGGWATAITPPKDRFETDPCGHHHVHNLTQLLSPGDPEKLKGAIDRLTTGEDFPLPKGVVSQGIKQTAFDDGSARKRRNAMVRVLEEFRDTGKFSWSKAAPWARYSLKVNA